MYQYDDPDLGQHFDFEWEASPASRINSKGCPFLSNQKIWRGYNDLKTRFPRIASEWNYKRNEKNPDEIRCKSTKDFDTTTLNKNNFLSVC